MKHTSQWNAWCSRMVMCSHVTSLIMEVLHGLSLIPHVKDSASVAAVEAIKCLLLTQMSRFLHH